MRWGPGAIEGRRVACLRPEEHEVDFGPHALGEGMVCRRVVLLDDLDELVA